MKAMFKNHQQSLMKTTKVLRKNILALIKQKSLWSLSNRKSSSNMCKTIRI